MFSAGNVVTGKGNIVASRKHAACGREQGRRGDREAPAARAPRRSSGVRARVRERQRAVGYTGDYASWMAKVTPPDLE